MHHVTRVYVRSMLTHNKQCMAEHACKHYKLVDYKTQFTLLPSPTRLCYSSLFVSLSLCYTSLQLSARFEHYNADNFSDKPDFNGVYHTCVTLLNKTPPCRWVCTPWVLSSLMCTDITCTAGRLICLVTSLLLAFRVSGIVLP